MKHDQYYTCDVCGKRFKGYADVRGDISLSDSSSKFIILADACDGCVKQVREFVISISKVPNQANVELQENGKLKTS